MLRCILLPAVLAAVCGQALSQPASLLSQSDFSSDLLTDIAGPGFARALRIGQRASAAPSTAIRKGDCLVAAFVIRSGDGSQGVARLRVAPAEGKAVEVFQAAGQNWRRVRIPLVADRDFLPGAYRIELESAVDGRFVEVGAFELQNYGAGFAASLGPDFPYEGRAADAPWRKQAAERINQIRKADLNIQVRDARGPVRGATVEVRMKRHAFPFGTAMASATLMGTTPAEETYRERLLELFNAVVFENDLKWPQWEANPQRALAGLDWLEAHGIQNIRGHTLVWPSWRWLPKDLPSLEGNPDAMRKRVMDHIRDELTATRGRLQEWDVLNEPYTNHDLMRIVGDDVMAQWFKQAREYEPNAALYINDFSILSSGGNDVLHQNHYFETIEKLIRSGAPLNGIGMQGHFSRQLTAPERVWEILDRFQQFGRKIRITEFDIDIDDEQLQADYTRDFLTAVYAHPAVDGFLMWGFWEGRHWRPRGAMFRRDWSVKPNGEVYRKLVFGDWWTNLDGKTDRAGRFQSRGFLGDYEITVRSGKRTAVHKAALAGKGGAIEIHLK